MENELITRFLECSKWAKFLTGMFKNAEVFHGENGFKRKFLMYII